EKFDTILIKDLSDDYLVFDYRYDTYVPLSGEKTCVANIYYDFSLYSDYNLAFTAAPGLALFIDHRLIYENVSSAKETAIVPVKSFLNGNPGKSLLTFYQKDKTLPADISLSHISTGVESADVSFKTRLANDLKNKKLFYVLILILT